MSRLEQSASPALPRVIRGEFAGQDWRKAQLSDPIFDRASFLDCRFEDVSFARFETWDEGQTLFRNCDFTNCRWRPNGPAGAGIVGDVRFEDCRFKGGWWKGWICHGVELLRCSFDTRLENVSFQSRPVNDLGRDRNQIEGNDFSKADLRRFAFRSGVSVCAQTWNPANHLMLLHAKPTLEKAKALVETRWRGEQLRKGLNDLEYLLEKVAEGQTDLIILPADLRAPELMSLLR